MATQPLGSLLDQLFRTPEVSAMEKTAEDQMLAALRTSGQVEDNPYAEMSTTELAKLAMELEQAQSAPPAETKADEEVLAKVASDTIGGQVMAHATLHEFTLIKEAMLGGLCRVCKENPMNVPGTSICSACQGA